MSGSTQSRPGAQPVAVVHLSKFKPARREIAGRERGGGGSAKLKIAFCGAPWAACRRGKRERRRRRRGIFRRSMATVGRLGWVVGGGAQPNSQLHRLPMVFGSHVSFPGDLI